MLALVFWLAVAAATLVWLARARPSLPVFTAAAAGTLVAASLVGALGGVLAVLAWGPFLAAALLFNVRALRRRFVAAPVLDYVRAVLPPMSDTERTAIEAGTVWWEAEMFRGDPDWRTLLAYDEARLTDAERAFLDGPTDELCRMLDDWRITHELNDLPDDVWAFVKREKFLGMVIPRRTAGSGSRPRATPPS